MIVHRLRPSADIDAIMRSLHRWLALLRAEGLRELIAAPFAERVRPRHFEIARVAIVAGSHFAPGSVGLWHRPGWVLPVAILSEEGVSPAHSVDSDEEPAARIEDLRVRKSLTISGKDQRKTLHQVLTAEDQPGIWRAAIDGEFSPLGHDTAVGRHDVLSHALETRRHVAEFCLA